MSRLLVPLFALAFSGAASAAKLTTINVTCVPDIVRTCGSGSSGTVVSDTPIGTPDIEPNPEWLRLLGIYGDGYTYTARAVTFSKSNIDFMYVIARTDGKNIDLSRYYVYAEDDINGDKIADSLGGKSTWSGKGSMNVTIQAVR